MATASDDLDTRFGVALSPGLVKPHESTALLSGSFVLDGTTAKVLQLLIETSTHASGLFEFLWRRLVILWIVTETGEIRFCLEEVCETAAPDRRYPRVRRMPSHPSLAPLGHPALVGGGRARIAGEIVLDDDERGRLVWTLTNQSGRYGIHPSRRRAHLDNVAAEFAAHGVGFDVHYIRLFS